MAQSLEGAAVWRLLEEELCTAIAIGEQSVVSIALVGEMGSSGPRIDPFGGDSGIQTPESPDFVPTQFGSGVILSRDDVPDRRFVLTNYHVVHPYRRTGAVMAPARLMVRLSSRHVVWATEIAGDPRSDLSVLELDLRQAGLTADSVRPFQLSERETFRKGEIVVVLGNPYALARDGSASASVGIISNISRRSLLQDHSGRGRDSTVHELGTLLTVDTRLQFGGSGGALIDLEGRLVGLTTSLAALRGYESSAGYAIPLDAGLRRVVNSLLAGYEAEYGFLGVALRDVPQDEAITWGEITQATAAAADFVAADSPAQAGGLRAGDLILRVNDKTVFDTADLTREVLLAGPDSTVELSVFRPTTREQFQLSIRLGKWPVHDPASIVVTAERWPRWRGLAVDYPTALGAFIPFEVLLTYHRAVLVREVVSDSVAEQAGLKAGDLITSVEGIEVQTPGQFHAAIAGQTGSVVLVLHDGRRISLPPADPGGD